MGDRSLSPYGDRFYCLIWTSFSGFQLVLKYWLTTCCLRLSSQFFTVSGCPVMYLRSSDGVESLSSTSTRSKLACFHFAALEALVLTTFE